MIGETVGNFCVIRQLGRGGMGEVWLAEHKEIKTRVAIKMLLPHISQDTQQVQRFFNEAVAVSKIKHAGIAKIFDVGFHRDGKAYLVMEFLDGESLGARISRAGRVDLGSLADIARQIASVLEATHDEGITHRDLKPDNVFLVRDAELDSGERVKILDFGIAKLGGGTLGLTGAGAMGTPAYMSPEQWKASAKVDGRADLYSLGCLVFEMACGRPPFQPESIGEACQLHLSETPPLASSFAPEVTPALDALIARLLAKAPEDRPAVREARTAFTAVRDAAVAVIGPTLGASDSFAVGVAGPAMSTAPHATTLGSSAMALVPPPRHPRRARAVWLAGGAALVLISAAAVARLAGGNGDREASPGGTAPLSASPPSAVRALPLAPPPVAAPTPVPLTSQVTITVSPATAEIRIDDAPVGAPFAGAFPRTDVRHRIEIRAAGYVTSSQWLTFETDRVIAVALDHERAHAPAPHTAPPVSAPVAHPTAAAVSAVAPPVTAPLPAPVPAPVPAPTGPSVYRGTQGTILTH